jgi:hypothetical protein
MNDGRKQHFMARATELSMLMLLIAGECGSNAGEAL